MSECSGKSLLDQKPLDKFISIHLSKCGGTTFRAILEKMYGEDLFWDKSECSINLHGSIYNYNMSTVKRAKVIHGHITPEKYKQLRRPYITWLRHPITRMESEYSVIFNKVAIKKNRNHTHGRLSRFHKSVENMSFLEYSEKVGNYYKNVLGALSVSDFAFIGIIEYYEESLALFSKVVGKEIPSHSKLNRRKMYKQLFKEGTAEEKKLCANVIREDINFYNECCLSLHESWKRTPIRSM